LAWCPSPAGPFHAWLGWGPHQPHYWQESLVLWFLHQKKVSLQPKILFKKTAGTTAMLPIAGLKCGNLKKPDLLSAIL